MIHSLLFYVCRRCICRRISFSIGSGEAHWRVRESWLLCSKRYHPKVWLYVPREAWFSLSVSLGSVSIMKFWLLGNLLLYFDSCSITAAFGFFNPDWGKRGKSFSERKQMIDLLYSSTIIRGLEHRFIFLLSLLLSLFYSILNLVIVLRLMSNLSLGVSFNDLLVKQG